ncbi:hypothetical protein J6590_056075 [Homalodisca vitripennis]|nr:hypothetical protein J6590_056075 [Homalodisca vitripennis]
MERFDRGGWREENIKTEEQGGQEEVEEGIRKGTFGSASACVFVCGEISFRRNKCQGPPIIEIHVEKLGHYISKSSRKKGRPALNRASPVKVGRRWHTLVEVNKNL